MSEKPPVLNIHIDGLKEEGDMVRIPVELVDFSLIGKQAEYKLIKKVHVLDAEGIDDDATLYSGSIVLGQESSIVIPKSLYKEHYSYVGAFIDISLDLQIKAPTGFIFKTKISEDLGRHLTAKYDLAQETPGVEEDDTYDFEQNLRAIPKRNRVIVMIQMIVSALVLLTANIAAVYYFAYIYPKQGFYPLRGFDLGAVIFVGLLLNGLTVFLWWHFVYMKLIKRQLTRYVELAARPLPAVITKDAILRLSDIATGRTAIDLDEAEVCVLATNVEYGSRMRGTGRSRRREYFKTPLPYVPVYSKILTNIPRGTVLDSLLNEPLDLQLLFSRIFPPNMLNERYGVSVVWKLQVRHPRYMDLDIELDPNVLRKEDFFTG